MPLWTTATRSVAIGCALSSVGSPCVAQRVWPMPIVPWARAPPPPAPRGDATPPAPGGRRPRRAPLNEVDELALRAAALDAAVDQGRDPGRIIAAIFEAPQPLDQLGGD